MVVLMDGGTGGASNIHGRQPDPLRKRRTNERHYVFDVAFGADSTQVTKLKYWTSGLFVLNTENILRFTYSDYMYNILNSII